MPLTILVADDDLGTRLSVTDYLELNGFVAVAAKNGREALAMVEQCRPHLIVTDIAMPQVDGHAFIRQIRSQPALRLLPVVFLTARDETADRIMGYQLGCDAYLAKPFELAELLAVVRNLLDRAQSVALEMQFSRSQQPANSALQPQSRSPYPREMNPPLEDEIPTPELSPREREVLNLLSSGGSNIQIGKELHLSPRTIEKHVSSLLRKTNMHNRSELVRYAIEHNLVN
ncbi:response regulator transcription factor [filamentous cyanobacterium LEGE 11480]|uniref:Response regulator transcription factor n=1 Tax=Romeriopsis navalis LEGE 11480 TaxID=2777977 RepID=A0A928VM43_9CYAN|nr:response regulator transcription factor [Romeriopsis navalis]MBE9031071.1 response regulator transcription factor [Romeriopsis navalis LEGE 11480]